jgi:hypothetical protein
MQLPSRPDRKVPGAADHLVRLTEAAHERTASGGKLGLLQHRGAGVVLASRPRGLQPAARIGYGNTCPFTMSITSSGVTRTVTFRAGTINSLLPSNYLTGVTVPASGTRYIVLDVTVVSGAITAAAFAADSTVPAAIAPFAGEPPTAFKILIGVVINAKVFKVWGCGNIQAIPVEAFRIQTAVPVAGQVPYDVYYTWELSVL